MENQKSLLQLFTPIFFEVIFYMLGGMVDTLMISSVSDQAVGAVGTANTYISMFIMMFAIISSGMIAVMTQNIGAGKPGIAYQAKKLGLLFNIVLGIGLSSFLFFFSGDFLQIVGIAANLQEPATIYLKIVGTGVIVNAILPIYSSYLRAFGYAKNPLMASMVGNLVNIILNAIFLFVFHWGVLGVAIATVVSRIANLIIVFISSKILIKAHKNPERISSAVLLGQIIKIGLPSAFESILYSLSMTLVIRFLNQMDADGLNVTARSYTIQIANFSFCAGSALAQANAILTGWRIGAKQFDECNRSTRKAALIGILIATGLEAIFALLGPVIVPIFTDDPEMIKTVTTLLTIDIALEVGRVTNLVYGQALKTSGDAVFPVVMAVAFMFICAVGGTYFFGIHLNMMVVGSYIGLALDEICRGIGVALRWKSGKWKEKSLVV